MWRPLNDTEQWRIALKSFLNEIPSAVQILSSCFTLKTSWSRTIKQAVFLSSITTHQLVGSSEDSVSIIQKFWWEKFSTVFSHFLVLQRKLTRNFWQKSNFWILVTVYDENSKVSCHYSTTRTLACWKNLGVNDFSVGCFLTHAKFMQILPKNIINQNDAIILNAQQFFTICPSNCPQLTWIPLCQMDKIKFKFTHLWLMCAGNLRWNLTSIFQSKWKYKLSVLASLQTLKFVSHL